MNSDLDRPSRRPRRLVPWVVAALVIAVLGGGAVAYRTGVLQRWFARDSDNEEELARLGAGPLRVPPAATTAGWPQWFGPLRDGRAPDQPFRTDWDKTPPKPLWSSPVGGGFSSFAVADGRVYTSDRRGDDERVVCLDAETGQLVWDHTYPADYKSIGYGSGPRAAPAVEDRWVYTLGATGVLLCLEMPAQKGERPRQVWRHELPAEFHSPVPQWGFASSPLIDGDRVIVQPGGRDASVVAFDKRTGAVVWKAGSNPAGYSSPVAATVHGVRLVLALTGDALLCVRDDGRVTGSFGWATRFNGNIATPLVLDDYVFITAAYDQGCALLRLRVDGDRVGLEPVYVRRNRPVRAHFSTPVAAGHYLYGFDTENGRLVCLNYLDGKEVDGWDAAGVKKGSLILAGNHLVILTQTGDLILAEARPDEFRLVAKIPTGFRGDQNWALPVLVGGRLYLRGEDRVVCLDLRP